MSEIQRSQTSPEKDERLEHRNVSQEYNREVLNEGGLKRRYVALLGAFIGGIVGGILGIPVLLGIGDADASIE
jgi:hypothetical protein